MMAMTNALSLAQGLLRCRSITPADDGALALLRAALEPLGFACHDVPFGPVKNLFARTGTGAPHFCFLGHADVVPPGDEAAWMHPPFAGAIADGKLYGRGAADMKGNIACFVAAAADFLRGQDDFRGSLSLLITGDEEGPAVDGTVRVLDWLKGQGALPDAALVGEPSNPEQLGDQIKIGRRGSLNGTLTVTGKQGHAAYPDLADNPLPRLIAMTQRLATYIFDAGNFHFAATNLQFTSIDTGNPAANVIPARAAARFNIRYNDRWTAQTVEQKLRALLDGVGGAYTLEVEGNAESFVTPLGPFTHLVRQAVQDVTGRTAALTTHGGTSDARFIAPFCPVVEFGLINKTIHQVDEHVLLDDVAQLTKIYHRILTLYFAETP